MSSTLVSMLFLNFSSVLASVTVIVFWIIALLVGILTKKTKGTRPVKTPVPPRTTKERSPLMS